MANSHKKSAAEGRVLCDSLYSRLREKIPLVERQSLKRGCGLIEPGQPKLCYIFHFTKLKRIQIWPYFDCLQVDQLMEFVGKIGLPITPRNSYAGMGRLYPLHIDLRTEADVRRAVKVLMYAREAKVKRDLERTTQPASKPAHRVALQQSLLPEEISDLDTFPEGGRKSIIINATREIHKQEKLVLSVSVRCALCADSTF